MRTFVVLFNHCCRCYRAINTSRFSICHSRFLKCGAAPIEPTVSDVRTSASSYGVNAFTTRTHTIGEVKDLSEGTRVSVCGWLQQNRGGRFLILRDKYGTVQCFVSNVADVKVMKSLHTESVLSVTGVVMKRPPKDVNPDMDSGEMELRTEKLCTLNESAPTPVMFTHDLWEANNEVQLKYRYLQLRKPPLQHALSVRSALVHAMRRWLVEECAFVEVETPTLFRGTPGGAREFFVDAGIDRFYALPQSPQQLKQLLMIGGVDRYFQIARCYRDEGTRTDRQPEFTQVDLELSFTDQRGVMQLVEGLIEHSWPTEMNQLKPTFPLPVMTYAEAMKLYGADKPDTRFGMQLMPLKCASDAENFVCGFVIPASYLQQLDADVELGLRTLITQEHGAIVLDRSFAGKKLDIFLSDETQRLLDCGGFLVYEVWKPFVANSDDKLPEAALGSLGSIRLKVAQYLQEHGIQVYSKGFNFLWVVDFPLFVITGSAEKMIKVGDAVASEANNIETPEPHYESAHHPFTAPTGDYDSSADNNDGDVLRRARGQHYDLVVNGVELGSGSVRIHAAALQRRVLDDVLQLPSAASLDYLVRALGYGAPPHGGFALGLDRYVALLLGRNSIRDVIAFPKSTAGNCVMSGAPASAAATDALRDTYSLA